MITNQIECKRNNRNALNVLIEGSNNDLYLSNQQDWLNIYQTGILFLMVTFLSLNYTSRLFVLSCGSNNYDDITQTSVENQWGGSSSSHPMNHNNHEEASHTWRVNNTVWITVPTAFRKSICWNVYKDCERCVCKCSFICMRGLWVPGKTQYTHGNSTHLTGMVAWILMLTVLSCKNVFLSTK